MSRLYKDIRPTIKSGDLLAWTSRSCRTFSDFQKQIIRLFTKSEYIHVGTAWVIGERVFVIEAVRPKVRIYPLSKLLPFYLIPLNAKWKKETEEFALLQIGGDYSIIQAMQSIFKKPDLDNIWECAELVREIMIKDDINLGDIYTPSEVVNAALSYTSGLQLIEK